MNALEHIIHQHIDQHGPMDVGMFMNLALSHPEHGYYVTRDPLGKSGDFTTAPEISQMFGELIGAWLADAWTKLGVPKRALLVEAGPGRGTLMADIIRATKMVSGFHAAAQIHLLEISPVLKDKQKKALSGYDPVWHDTLNTLPQEVPILFVANEFFDALPIRQFVKGAEVWQERVIGADGDALCFGVRDVVDLPGAFPEAHEGDVFEVSSTSCGFMRALAGRIKAQGGAGLIIDYGHAQSGLGETLQAVKDHAYADPLQDVGQADLTAHVDFTALKEVAEDMHVSGPVPQGTFLKHLGIDIRAAQLKQKADARQQDDIDAAMTRLTACDQMGNLFKVMGFCHDPDIFLEGF